MKSKAHFKKGVELDLNPTPVDDIKQLDSEDMEDYSEDNMDEDDDIDDEDDDEEAVDKLGWRKTQSDFDAARSLLRLSQVFPSQIPQSNHAKAGILPFDHRPVSYPYQSPLSVTESEVQINHQTRTQISSPLQSSSRLEVPPVPITTVFNNPVVIQTTPADLRHHVKAVLNSSPKSIVNKPMDLSRFGGSKELEQISKSQVAGSQSSKKPKALFRQPTTNGPSQKYTRYFLNFVKFLNYATVLIVNILISVFLKMDEVNVWCVIRYLINLVNYNCTSIYIILNNHSDVKAAKNHSELNICFKNTWILART